MRELIYQKFVLVEVVKLDNRCCAIACVGDDLIEELLNLWNVEIRQAIKGRETEAMAVSEGLQKSRFTRT